MVTTRPIALAQLLTGAGATLALLYFLRSILIPFVVAFVLAILAKALVRWIRGRMPAAPPLTVAAIAGGFIILGAAAAIYVVVMGAAEIVGQGPALIVRVEDLIAQLGHALGLEKPLRLRSMIGATSIPRVAGAILNGVQNIASGLFLMIVYFGFILSSQTRLAPKVRNIATSSDHADAIKRGMARVAANIETYVWVQTLTGLMLAGVAGALMLSVGLNNVLFWTIILFLLSFIPLIGVTVGAAAPALFALLQFPTLWPALAVFAGIQASALVIGNLVYPRIQANAQNIDPVTTILALSLWTLLWGVPGAFLAMPLTLMFMIACAQFQSTQWIAILLSDDGRPQFLVELQEKRFKRRRPTSAGPSRPTEIQQR
jgi:AI-2 transport protein TqsA